METKVETYEQGSDEEEVDAEAVLMLVSQLFTEKYIDEDQRDTLKGKLIIKITNRMRNK